MSYTDIRSMNKAVLAHKKLKDLKAAERTVVFVTPKPKVGASKQEIRFPYAGNITEVYISCAVPGIERTVLQVEKCSQADFDTSPVWSSVTETFILDPNEKSTATSSYSTVITVPAVNENDHLRLSYLEVGAGLEGLTVEVIITL